jgi:ribosomal protein S18 acetylase RimI-like enzyme
MTVSDVTIRLATPTDDSILVALAVRLTAFPLPPWRTAVEIASADARAMRDAVRAGRPDDDVLIAERNATVVGCLHILAVTDFFGRRHAHISVLATTEAAQGSGVGRALMAYAEEWTLQRELTLVTLNVFAGNARARGFYEHAGFGPEVVKYVKELGAGS